MIFAWVKTGWSKVQSALQSTRKILFSKLSALFTRAVDETLLEELEEILFEADLGAMAIKEIIHTLRTHAKTNPSLTLQESLTLLEHSLLSQISHLDHTVHLSPNKPTVFLIVGTNGSGKTTSIAKLCHSFLEERKTVLLAAADTFRAAAKEQLSIWANRLHVDIIVGSQNADPAAVTYDAIKAAQAKNIDIVLIDTAGRLENKHHLMQELEKIHRTCKKLLPDAPHEVLLVIDATVGQNGIEQAKTFHRFLGVSGLILTKLDGTAKGGVVIAIEKNLMIPVKYVGVGEHFDHLIPFDPQSFIHSLFSDEGTSV